MSPQRNESLDTYQQLEGHTQQSSNDRSGLIGLLALLGIAFPALGIRYLFPSLNPMLLAGLGIAVYGVYLGLLAHHSVNSNDPELARNPVVVEARDR
jgi:hypothetical protein